MGLNVKIFTYLRILEQYQGLSFGFVGPWIPALDKEGRQKNVGLGPAKLERWRPLDRADPGSFSTPHPFALPEEAGSKGLKPAIPIAL